jgi:hypothetical protein
VPEDQRFCRGLRNVLRSDGGIEIVRVREIEGGSEVDAQERLGRIPDVEQRVEQDQIVMESDVQNVRLNRESRRPRP